MPRAASGLSAKQRRFVAEFLASGNASDAAIRAGYSPKVARRRGYKLIRQHPAVRAAIQEAEKDRMAELEICAAQLDQRLKDIASAQSAVDLALLGVTGADQIRAIKLLYERLGALEPGVAARGTVVLLPRNGREAAEPALDWRALLLGGRTDDEEG